MAWPPGPTKAEKEGPEACPGRWEATGSSPATPERSAFSDFRKEKVKMDMCCAASPSHGHGLPSRQPGLSRPRQGLQVQTDDIQQDPGTRAISRT